MFSNVMFYFVLPITILTLAIAVWRSRAVAAVQK
jgi:hypothetical protein